MNWLCFQNCLDKKDKKNQRHINQTVTKKISSTDILNLKIKGRSVCKAQRKNSNQLIKDVSKNIKSNYLDMKREKISKDEEHHKKEFKKNIELKSQFKCLFCGGKKCPYENYLNNPNFAIEGLHCDLIENTIYAGQRPCNFLIKKFNLINKFLSNNIGLIVNLQKQGEHPYCGPGEIDYLSGYSYNPSLFASEGIKVKLAGWRELSPESNNFMLDIVKEMAYTIKVENKKVYVHCHTGNSRTAIVVGCYMIYSNKSKALDACELAKHYREKFFEKKDQIKYCVRFQEYLASLREIFTIEKYPVAWFLKNQWDLEVRLRDAKSKNVNYIPYIIYKSLNKLLQMKNDPKRPYSNNGIYRALNGSLEITDDTFVQIKYMMSKINAGFWEALDQCDSTVILSEIFYLWVDESVKFCVSPKRVIKIVKNEQFILNIDNILGGKCNNANTLFEMYSFLKKIFKKYEFELFKFLGDFIDKIYPNSSNTLTNNTNNSRKSISNVSMKSSNKDAFFHEVKTTFSKDESEEYYRMVEKIAIYIVGYNIDLLYDEEVMINENSINGSFGDVTIISKSLCSSNNKDDTCKEYSLFELMESVVKIIEFFRIISMTSRNGGYTFEQSKYGGFFNSSPYKDGDNSNSHLNSILKKVGTTKKTNGKKRKSVVTIIEPVKESEDNEKNSDDDEDEEVNYSYYLSSSLGSSSSDEDVNDENKDTFYDHNDSSLNGKDVIKKKITNKKIKRKSVESRHERGIFINEEQKGTDTSNDPYNFFNKKRNTTNVHSIRLSQFKRHSPNSHRESVKENKKRESKDILPSSFRGSNKLNINYKPNKMILSDNKNKDGGDFILNKIEHNNNILIFKPPEIKK